MVWVWPHSVAWEQVRVCDTTLLWLYNAAPRHADVLTRRGLWWWWVYVPGVLATEPITEGKVVISVPLEHVVYVHVLLHFVFSVGCGERRGAVESISHTTYCPFQCVVWCIHGVVWCGVVWCGVWGDALIKGAVKALQAAVTRCHKRSRRSSLTKTWYPPGSWSNAFWGLRHRMHRTSR